jgi:hypothetical protein
MAPLTIGEWVDHCRRWNVNVAGDTPTLTIDTPVPEIPQVIPNWLPTPDPPQPFTGPDLRPTPDDIYNFVSAAIKKKLGEPLVQALVNQGQQLNAINTSNGEMIKALSYFMIQDEQSNIDLHNKLVIAIDQGQLDLVGHEIQVGFILVDMQATAALNFAEAYYHAEDVGKIAVAKAQQYADGVAALNRQWAMDTIFTPLTDRIGQVETAGRIADVQVAAMIPPEAQKIASATVAPVAAEVATLAPALTFVEGGLKTLQDQATNCLNDMCKTMGPGSALGKFLKALDLLGSAALLAELATLDGAGIENLLKGLASLAQGITNDIEALFTGGENVGQLLTKIGG